MDEEKLVKLLEKRFPTKKEFLAITKNLEDLDSRVLSLKHRLYSFVLEMHEFRKETKEEFKSISQNFENINEKLDQLKSSSNTLDSILEQYPIERIKRLEKHSKLSPFVPVVSAE